MFAPPRPVPRQLFDQLRYKTGVLVQSIKGCAGFQVSTLLGTQHNATRPWPGHNSRSLWYHNMPAPGALTDRYPADSTTSMMHYLVATLGCHV